MYHSQATSFPYINSYCIPSCGAPKNYFIVKSKEITLYKTESCRNWAELGYCRYGSKCCYAHGESELRFVPRHTRYKTQICRAYHMDGSCPYGIRCAFVHDSDHVYNTINNFGELRNSFQPHNIKTSFMMKRQPHKQPSIQTTDYSL